MDLVWWLVIGIVVLALLILALAALPVLRRLPGVRRTGERLRRQAAALEGVQRRAEELQQRGEALAATSAQLQDGVARLRARRDGT